jgi:hypothetical protein
MLLTTPKDPCLSSNTPEKARIAMSEVPQGEVFAIEFAALAREVAMDIFPIHDIVALHRLTAEEWERVQKNPKFVAMVADMSAEWNSAANTRERVRIKAATGLESVLETYIRDITDPQIPLNQRVEAGKFLARVGELDNAQQIIGGGGGSGFHIQLNIGGEVKQMDARIIEGTVLEDGA